MHKETDFSHLLTAAKKERISLSCGEYFLCLLSVYDSLICSAQAEGLAQKLMKEGALQSEAEAVAENACLASFCLFGQQGCRAFSSGEEALHALTLDDLSLTAAAYHRLRAEGGFARGLDAKALQDLKRRASDPMERIRWKVLSRFHALPNSRAARRMGDGDFLYCWIHMLLDWEEEDDDWQEQSQNGSFPDKGGIKT